MTPVGRPGPIADADRADILDALRGFALLGIFISHIPDFSGYSFMTPAEQALLDRFGIDSALAPLQDFLIRGKFYSLFSLLFGIGFALQLESAERRDASFASHFARRLLVLLLIGLAHASLWYGDILKDYAILGFALIPLRRASATVIASVAACAFALRVLWPAIMAVLVPIAMTQSSSGDPGRSFDALTQAFSSTNYADVFIANLHLVELKALQVIYDGRAKSILVMFLLGALVGKLGLFRNVEGNRQYYRKIFLISAPIGVIGNAFLTPIHAVTPDFPPSAMWVVENCLYAIAVPALAIAYASAFAWAWSSRMRPLLALTASVGRMALSTYVSQTLLGLTFFYGLGFGMRGQIGLADGTILAMVVFAIQCAIATAWLRWFLFGPVEWLWRRLTYGKPIPFKRRT